MRTTEGAISSSGVIRSQLIGGEERRPVWSRSPATESVVATAKELLQVLVGELGQVGRARVDILLLYELAHLVVDAVGEGAGCGRTVRDARRQLGALELPDELPCDRVEDVNRHIGAGRNRALLRVERSLAGLGTADLEPVDSVVTVRCTFGQSEGVAHDHVRACGTR